MDEAVEVAEVVAVDVIEVDVVVDAEVVAEVVSVLVTELVGDVLAVDVPEVVADDVALVVTLVVREEVTEVVADVVAVMVAVVVVVEVADVVGVVLAPGVVDAVVVAVVVGVDTPQLANSPVSCRVIAWLRYSALLAHASAPPPFMYPPTAQTTEPSLSFRVIARIALFKPFSATFPAQSAWSTSTCRLPCVTQLKFARVGPHAWVMSLSTVLWAAQLVVLATWK